VHNKDITFGTTQGFVFGFIVAEIARLRGLHTKSGPSSVDLATTRSVVSGILLFVIADVMFASLLFILNK
jgi:ABC-type transporter Mla maintaining outer membrane lipid asymmetry permease subunit MlaE